MASNERSGEDMNNIHGFGMPSKGLHWRVHRPVNLDMQRPPRRRRQPITTRALVDPIASLPIAGHFWDAVAWIQDGWTRATRGAVALPSATLETNATTPPRDALLSRYDDDRKLRHDLTFRLLIARRLVGLSNCKSVPVEFQEPILEIWQPVMSTTGRIFVVFPIA